MKFRNILLILILFLTIQSASATYKWWNISSSYMYGSSSPSRYGTISLNISNSCGTSNTTWLYLCGGGTFQYGSNNSSVTTNIYAVMDNETSVPLYFENISNSNNYANVWINITSSTSKYQIYINSTSRTLNNTLAGRQVFRWEDDMEDGSTTGWWTTSVGTLTESAGRLSWVTNTGNYQRLASNYSPTAAGSWYIRAKVKAKNSVDGYLYIGQTGTDGAGGATPGIYLGKTQGTANFQFITNDGVATTTTLSTSATYWVNNYVIMEVRKQPGRAEYYLYDANGILIESGFHTTNVPAITNPLGFHGANNLPLYADYFLIGDYNSSDVAWATWGYMNFNNNVTNDHTSNFSILTGQSVQFNITNPCSCATQWWVDSVFQSLTSSPFSYTFSTNKTYFVENYIPGSSLTTSWNVTALSYPIELLTPADTASVTSPVTLTWREWPAIMPHTYQISSDAAFINIVASGTVTSTTENFSVTTALTEGTYYWHVKNDSGSYTSSRSLTITPTSALPGQLNISVIDERYYNKSILNFSAELYQGSGSTSTMIVQNTTTGWVNLSYASHGITQTEYLLRIIPNLGNASYAERSILVTPNATPVVYVPNSSENTIDLIAFKLQDDTGFFPYTQTRIYLYNNGSLMSSGYFDAEAKNSVYLIRGVSYSITLNHMDMHIQNWGNYIAVATGTANLVVSNFDANATLIYPFSYNISYNASEITLNYQSLSNITSLNFQITKGNTTNVVHSFSTTVTFGQSQYIVTNTSDIYYVTFYALNQQGWNNRSFVIDYRLGTRRDSTGTSTIDGSPIGIGFKFDSGTFTMPDWVYNLISIILTILLLGTFGAKHSKEGGVITTVFLLILASWGWFRPLGSYDANNYGTMALTGGLVFLSVLYYFSKRRN